MLNLFKAGHILYHKTVIPENSIKYIHERNS